MLKNDSSPIWERPERQPRPVPVPLSREVVVQAAIALADAEGLSSVTLRKVAGALGAGPMRLYGYIATKEELFALMVDAIYAEMLEGEDATGAWRARIARLAGHLRSAALRHPWFAALLGGRPQQGPNALAFTEAMLSAVAEAPGIDDIDTVFLATKVIGAYVVGAVCDEAADAAATRESGQTKAQWQDANWPYIQRVIATGRFPMLSKVAHQMTHPAPGTLFGRGLDRVLDGIAGTTSTSR